MSDPKPRSFFSRLLAPPTLEERSTSWLLDYTEALQRELRFSDDFFLGRDKGPIVRRRLNCQLGEVRAILKARQETP